MPTKLAVFGAGGSMGTRVLTALEGDAEYHLLPVEVDPHRAAAIRARGLPVITTDQACREAEAVMLAVPDNRIGGLAAAVVPLLNSGTLVICLDPAAPYAGKLPPRQDIAYFVTHPAHPPVFNDEVDPEARRDFFGSGKAKQAIVSALMQGTEADYARGEAISARIFAPILRSHRVSVEQMALLEPVLSETVTATCLTIIREALDEAIRRGVPAEAARDFLLGHLGVELAILFNEIDWQFSEGAKRAIEEAKPLLFREDWKRVFDPDLLRQSVMKITAERPT